MYTVFERKVLCQIFRPRKDRNSGIWEKETTKIEFRGIFGKPDIVVEINS